VGVYPANLPDPARWSNDEAKRQRKGLPMSNQYTLPDYSNILKPEDYERLFAKALKVIGRNQIDAMSKAQVNLLNASLGRILRRHGTVDTITDLEFVGAYEMVVEHVLPGFLEDVFSKVMAQRT
jgi:hypothetical protein